MPDVARITSGGRRTLALAGVLLVLALTKAFVLETCRISGNSMYPTLRDGEIHLVFKAAYLFSEPRRGDIVAVHPTGAPRVVYVKRIVAVAGDLVQIEGGRVYLNGEPLSEPYALGPTDGHVPPRVIPKGEVFVLGDNRTYSGDSREWAGYGVKVENIRGKVIPLRWGRSR